MRGPDRYHIGQAYGGSRGAGGWRGASGVIEWEWVHTGRDFARSHPLGAFGGGLWAVAAGVALHGLGAAYLGVHGSPAAWLWCLLDAATLILLWRRSRLAWPLTWASLIAAFPLSAPLMVYWADATRPNLIYRHRFERLVWPKEADADVL